MSYINHYIEEAIQILQKIDQEQIEKIIKILLDVRKKHGRLFILGVGGSAGNASHAVNDFRKLAGFEAYSPVDNVSELMARTNDEGWETVFVEWLKVSCLKRNDAVLVFSVGGGNLEKNISANLVRALEYAKTVDSKVLGIVGRDGGYTARVADACVIVPTVNPETITPHAESFQGVIWHLIASDVRLKMVENKWESTVK
ncbi:MAG: SIS domain-containing protein [Nitrososphaerales archaeon]|jgi:D-sedoheptulose 7-phosphate isomerase|nr:SIS domain-containing protein [Nitrososphaerales archaeon]|tara:strand:- start:852 stop:1451 length:600 start_codon:yes stop_codon:yes gene_type:complete